MLVCVLPCLLLAQAAGLEGRAETQNFTMQLDGLEYLHRVLMCQLHYRDYLIGVVTPEIIPSVLCNLFCQSRWFPTFFHEDGFYILRI